MCEEKSITRASRRCHISQPSISNAIIQLEELLETNLFIRHKKGVDLTEQARYLYPLAQKIVNDANKLYEIFAETPHPKLLRLGLFPDLSQLHLRKLLSDIHKEVPELRLELVDYGTEADGRLTLDVQKNGDELFFPLWEEDYLVCMPRDHPLAPEEKITTAMLQAHPFIECPQCEAHRQTMGILAGAGIHLNVACRADHKGQALHLVQAGLGISFLPTGVVEYGRDCIARPFDGPRMFRRVGLCYPSNTSENKVIPLLMDAVYKS